MLGAYKGGVASILEDACPYGTPLAIFEWKGACSHSGLVECQRTNTDMKMKMEIPWRLHMQSGNDK
jgi:hypothetical protein